MDDLSLKNWRVITFDSYVDQSVHVWTQNQVGQWQCYTSLRWDAISSMQKSHLFNDPNKVDLVEEGSQIQTRDTPRSGWWLQFNAKNKQSIENSRRKSAVRAYVLMDVCSGCCNLYLCMPWNLGYPIQRWDISVNINCPDAFSAFSPEKYRHLPHVFHIVFHHPSATKHFPTEMPCRGTF